MAKQDWRKFYKPLPELSGSRKRVDIYSFGPHELFLRGDIDYQGGPEEFVKNNPQLFKTGSTSRDEGYFYWGCLRVIGKEREPGKQGITWLYQSKVAGGMTQAGGSVVDFRFSGVMQGYDIGVRIVTKRFHNQAGPLKQATDELQRYTMLDAGLYAVDVQSSDYINDNTGRAVIRAVEDAINGTPGLSPIYAKFGTL